MFLVTPTDRACFLDGGGKLREHRVIAFCGFIAHPYALDDFERMWGALSSASGLANGLHMTDAMAWADDWAQKRRVWGSEADAQRTQILRTYAEVIRRSPLRGVGHVADSRFISDKGMNTVRPDLVLFDKAMQTIAAGLPPDALLTVFCDWEDGFDVLCCKLLSKLRIQRPDIGRRIKMISFGDDKSFAELQAADMFAYYACKEAIRRVDAPDSAADPIFTALTEKTLPTEQPMVERLDAETFERMVEAQR